MYQVFVNDKPIVLTTIDEEKEGYWNFPLKEVNIEGILNILLSKKKIKGIKLIHHKEKKLLKKFLKLLPNVVAGGGKVYNDDGKILFIYRNDKWDLPKGKVEGKESIETTAIREVEEETGVINLEIVKPLPTTYHIFKRNGNYKIKITYWFEMKTNYIGKLFPQENEGITKVKWLSEKKIEKAMKNSYANIKQLI
ncbi:NUDIX domain-containing protein [Flavobacteriaceae bacterium AU392]|nr:NUDIX domain-containing protein [Flavobacteriaceae bacterium]RKM82920.1 NUDIX domain-containing protein [Flavobacteriaceae bacterium AU392]